MKNNFFTILFYMLLISIILTSTAVISEKISFAEDASVLLRVPQGAVAAKVFDEFLPSLEEEYSLKSIIHFIPGDYPLPVKEGKYPIQLIDYVDFSPSHIKGIPRKTGFVEVKQSSPDWVDYTISETIDIGSQVLEFSIEYLGTQMANGLPVTKEFVFDEPFLDKKAYMIGRMMINGEEGYLKFASEKYISLSLYLFKVTLEGGQFIDLYVRWQEPMAGSGPANLVYAVGSIQEGSFHQNNYWKLVYSAFHHNWDEKFWVLFDTPINGAYGIAVFTRNVMDDQPKEVYTLDANLKRLRTIPLVKIEKNPTDKLPEPSLINTWDLY